MLVNEITQYESEWKDKNNWKDIAAALNYAAWNWYRNSGHDMEKPLFTIRKFGFISFTVKMKHLESIFEFIFGAKPTNASLQSSKF